VARKGGIDQHLLEALTRSYTLRARLFHVKVRERAVDRLIAEINAIKSEALKWDLNGLGITTPAFKRVSAIGCSPHLVFAHPEVLCRRPHLIAYYRNIATISNKGMSQVLFSTSRYESGSAKTIPAADCSRLCHML